MPVYQNCSLMAVPVTCDCKKKLAGWLSARRPTSILHVPANRERDEDMERFVGELYAFSRQLEGITGQPLSYENLSAAFRLTANAQYQLSRFIDLRRKHPKIIRGTFAMAAMNAMSYTWAPEWHRSLQIPSRLLPADRRPGVKYHRQWKKQCSSLRRV